MKTFNQFMEMNDNFKTNDNVKPTPQADKTHREYFDGVNRGDKKLTTTKYAEWRKNHEKRHGDIGLYVPTGHKKTPDYVPHGWSNAMELPRR